MRWRFLHCNSCAGAILVREVACQRYQQPTQFLQSPVGIAVSSGAHSDACVCLAPLWESGIDRQVKKSVTEWAVSVPSTTVAGLCEVPPPVRFAASSSTENWFVSSFVRPITRACQLQLSGLIRFTGPCR